MSFKRLFTPSKSLLYMLALCSGLAWTTASQAQEGPVVNGQYFSAKSCAIERWPLKAPSTPANVCRFEGTRTVAYGTKGQFTTRTVTGPVDCSNETFGDAAKGSRKKCYLDVRTLGNAPVATAPQPQPQPQPVAAAITRAEAARLLTQATYGPTMAEIDRVVDIGASAWVNEQFNTPSMDSHWAYVMVRKGPLGCTVCNADGLNAVRESYWMQAVRGPDQLRQRTVLALSEIFVVSSAFDRIARKEPLSSYLDMLSRNAFGNYRTLLQDVSTHVAMGMYLSHMQNFKENHRPGQVPDENFARELMQLFSIGLWELNPDGTRKKDALGRDIPTYGNEDVMGLAKVFTGYSWNGPDTSGSRWWGMEGHTWNEPMQIYPWLHSTSEKKFLGTTIAANTSGPDSLRMALDTIFNHPNVGPFIGRQLIQRFVTSNPSPAYVARVAAAFNNNGAGVRGDMKAVLRAVLLDNEARAGAPLNQASWGKLREPLVRLGNWLRAFDASATSGIYAIWNMEDTVTGLGQNILQAPSVFNWYRPDYAPSGNIQNQGLAAPEFQITDETSVTGYANLVTHTVARGYNWYEHNIKSSYTPELALAGNPSALMDRLDLLLTAGRMSATTRQIILDAVHAVPASQPQARVHTAITLTMLSPEFIVQK
jgi:uncharacterized protein (DUF1800 family)